LVLSGELRPATEASILARVNGYVRRWNVDLGATVEAGQVLAELDTPDTDRELSQAKAQSAVNRHEDAAAVDVRPGGRSRPRPAVPTRARRWAKPSAPRSAARRSRNPGSR